MSVLLLLVLLGGVVWFWQDSLQARDVARGACLAACRRSGVQLLDDTVVLERIWPRRNPIGRLCLERRYSFEFTDTGATRIRGVVVLLANRIDWVALDGGDLFIP